MKSNPKTHRASGLPSAALSVESTDGAGRSVSESTEARRVAPGTTRLPLPEPTAVGAGVREAHAVAVRAKPWTKRGKRMARFRTERLNELKSREAEAFKGALPVVHHHVERMRSRAVGQDRVDVVPESAEALTAALQSALQSARLNRLSVMVEDFRRSGFHHLFAELLARGTLTTTMAKRQRDHLKDAVDARKLSGDAVKRGFLVFDGLAQRLALLRPDLKYDLDGASRVFLETYAGSFHRG